MTSINDIPLISPHSKLVPVQYEYCLFVYEDILIVHVYQFSLVVKIMKIIERSNNHLRAAEEIPEKKNL